MSYSNPLIYGNDQTEGIVSIEVKDNKVHTYFNDGHLEIKDAVYFVTSKTKLNNSFERLDGENDYKWVKIYKKFENYKYDKKQFWRLGDSTYTVHNPVESHMVTRGSSLFKGLKFDQISRLGFDIESDGLLKHNESRVYLIANTFRDINGNETKKVFSTEDYENDGDMIADWCDWVRSINPTLMIGHNVIGYDFPYLEHVARLHGKGLKLGRDNSYTTFAKKPRNYRVDGSQTWEYKDVSVFGRHVIDTMFLSVKYDIGKQFPSWGLKPIIEHLGLVKDNRQFYDASKIHENWSNPIERKKIIEYAIDDGDDALNLYEIMAPSFFYLNQSIPKNFQALINSASGSWINMIFVRAYLQDFKALPCKSEVDRFEGAISYGVPGVYSNCFKQDVASLYPSIMRQYNIGNPRKDPEGYFGKVVEHFTLERLKNKKLAADTKDPYYKALEQSQKIVINSMYGFLGAKGLNFNCPKSAEEVTKYGRDILTKAMVWATNKDIEFWKEIKPHTPLYEIDNGSDLVLVNCDTDSIMITKKSGEFWTNEERERFLVAMNDQFDELIVWEDDGFYDRVVVVKAKNYALLEEGSDKLKFKGSSFKDAKKEPALKEMMLKMIDGLVYKNSDYSETYEDYIKEVLNINDISRWCTKKSVTENLLEANDTAKKRVLAALESINYRVGDKVYLFKDIDGKRQRIAKGEPVFLKSGKPSMVDNEIYVLKDRFKGTYNKKHYLERCFKTAVILENIIDMSKLKNYSLVKNYKELVDNEQ